MYYTREQILGHILELRPLAALTLKNGNRLQAVRTQIYDGVIVNGETIVLQRGPGNTYVAGYCRVSMPIQVEDGFSDKEQAEAIVDRFNLRRLGICEYGISSGSPLLTKHSSENCNDVPCSGATQYKVAGFSTRLKRHP